VLAIAEAASPPSSTLLRAALNLANRRVEGRLEALFIRAVGADDARAAQDAANLLRGAWVAPDVEDAVVAAAQRHTAGGATGLWFHVLGQMRPTRAARAELVLRWMLASDEKGIDTLGNALDKWRLDASARPVVARVAAENLAKAPSASLRDYLLGVLDGHGTREQAPAVRALADNELLPDGARRRARELAEDLERRP
jgi:hypothetical protein